MGEYYYLTHATPKKHILTLEEVLFDLITDVDLYRMNTQIGTGTRTNCYEEPIYLSQDEKRTRKLYEHVTQLRCFYERYRYLDIFYNNEYNYEEQIQIEKSIKSDMIKKGEYDEAELKRKTEQELQQKGIKYNPYYYTFWIPKQKGGLRRIDAPSDELKEAQAVLKVMFEKFMNGNTYHTSAFAYIPHRSAADVGRKLQHNNSRWILKTDFSDFFGSITIDFAMRQLLKIYPFFEIEDIAPGILRSCLRICFLNGRLPQGTPISPLLTNILMIPLDYKISNALLHGQDITTFDRAENDANYRLIYTRYADDINIGSHRGFNAEKVIEYIEKIITEEKAPFVIKPEKTRYCSTAGQNWILGLMFNQDNEITIGHKRKKQIKAMLSNFAMDYKNGQVWEAEDIFHVLGNVAYMNSVEKEYGEKLIANLNNKFSMDILENMKNVAYHHNVKNVMRY